jgi:hypothetical protein
VWGLKSELDSSSGSQYRRDKAASKLSNLNRYLVEALIEDYQKLNTKPKTKTVNAAIVLEDAEGLPLIVSVKDTQPSCDLDALTSLLDNRTSQGWQLVGKVFNEASARVSKAWIVPFPGFDSSSLHAASEVFQRQADTEKRRWFLRAKR